MLPKFGTADQALSQLQSTWAAALDPLLKLPIANSLILKNIVLSSGSNTINHKLGRNLMGWTIVRQRAGATIYDTQDTSPTPALTLTLVSSAPVSVDLLVF